MNKFFFAYDGSGGGMGPCWSDGMEIEAISEDEASEIYCLEHDVAGTLIASRVDGIVTVHDYSYGETQEYWEAFFKGIDELLEYSRRIREGKQ